MPTRGDVTVSISLLAVVIGFLVLLFGAVDFISYQPDTNKCKYAGSILCESVRNNGWKMMIGGGRSLAVGLIGFSLAYKFDEFFDRKLW